VTDKDERNPPLSPDNMVDSIDDER
jgi:hypothetical protein